MIDVNKSQAYVFPGAGQDARSYDNLRNLLESLHYQYVPIEIDWSRRSFTQWNQQAISQTQDEYGFNAKCYLPYLRVSELTPTRQYDISIGFSYGSIIGLMSYIPNRIFRINCSTPNVFDASLRPKFDAATQLAHGFTVDWSSLNDFPLCKNWEKDFFLYGSQESPRYASAAKSLEQMYGADFASVSDLVDGTGHDINSPPYVEKIREILVGPRAESLHARIEKR